MSTAQLFSSDISVVDILSVNLYNVTTNVIINLDYISKK